MSRLYINTKDGNIKNRKHIVLHIDNLATTDQVDAYDFTSLYPERVELHL